MGLAVSCSDVEPTPGRATFANLPHIASSGLCESYPPHPSVCEWSQSVDAVLIAKINRVRLYDQEFLDESGNFVSEEECFYKNYGLIFEVEIIDMVGNFSRDAFPKEIHMGIWDQFYFAITPLVHDSGWVEVIDVRNEKIKYFQSNAWVGWGVTQTQDRHGNPIWSVFHEMPFVVREEGLIQFGKTDDCYPFKPPSFEGNWEYLKETISACRPLEDNPYREARDFTQTLYKNTYIGICDTDND